MEKAIKLTPIEDDGVVYTTTPKGSFLGWLLDNKERLDAVLSGDDRPTEILFEELYDNAGWELVGYYQPKYCPNCGRELMENQKETE